MNEQDRTRAQMLGGLIRDARRYAQRSIADCAEILNMTAEEFQAAEEGEAAISLPHLEALSLYLDVPMAFFWGSESLPEEEGAHYAAMLALRHKIIGGLLRQARLEAGRSQEEMAEAIDGEVEQIQAYEAGREEIPYLDLEKLASELRLPISYFVDDQRGPLGRRETEREMQRQFEALPPEVRNFVSRPANMPYLRTAMRLSQMDADRLRSIATAILDITL